MDIHKLIGNLPKPKKGWVLPNHKYTGPYNPLEKQLDERDLPRPGQEPYNAVDAISMRHDICYRDHAKEKGGKHKCDDVMLNELAELNSKSEIFAACRHIKSKLLFPPEPGRKKSPGTK